MGAFTTRKRKGGAVEPRPSALLTTNDTARRLNITPDRLANLRDRGWLSAVDLGPGIGWRYARHEVETFAQQRKRGENANAA